MSIPSAIAVRSRFQNIDGGYKLQKNKVCGRPSYYSEEDKTYVVYCDFDEVRKWLISEQGNFDNDEYSWLVASEESDCLTPDLAKKYFKGGTFIY